jgi:hypothetical protein
VSRGTDLAPLSENTKSAETLIRPKGTDESITLPLQARSATDHAPDVAPPPGHLGESHGHSVVLDGGARHLEWTAQMPDACSLVLRPCLCRLQNVWECARAMKPEPDTSHSPGSVSKNLDARGDGSVLALAFALLTGGLPTTVALDAQAVIDLA